ncbi:nicotinate-nucleotide--dimethylbenzimidazole phosphoribosyltransferase [Halomonas chromatireducens]|uniref:Nicotinate-nucleotide--dimethylbenzimidazole phosphoribosyltransferase n=1 Tax=Halomonas chromatireducens TaxID=507626 RepID=A0A120JWM2_9GAMM|nr:nicotinate-nucleotide--dimethylbenzimidazole phosphoribosyltransferase [Halomonas chromatireducens]AMD02193.1 Nicotinate-nucleotide--dimethylbenzimidazole phosphoribosyltransferase [Halomonas chromatireducens]
MLADPLARLQSTDRDIAGRVADHLDQLTKPPGSLGRLESLAITLATITGEELPRITPPGVLVFAADHGVAAEGVSAFPQAVTAQMVGNFVAGGAAINVFARQIGARLEVIDVGVASELSRDSAARGGESGLVHDKVRRGTANFAEQDAMQRSEAVQAIEVGIRAAERAVAAGCRCLIVGEMGIANTTASSAMLAVLTGEPVADLTGQGTGIPESRLAHKQAVIERAIEARAPDPQDPLDILSKLGGLEIAAMAGAYLGGASRRVPLLVDGFIATVAALLACRIDPKVRDYLVFGHRSREPGHVHALTALGGDPLLELGLRLGEGTGAALAFPLLEAATRMLADMATFASAGVAGSEGA